MRTNPPEPGPLRSFDVPAVASRSLDNGLDLRIARMPRLPAVAVNLVLTAGEAALEHDRAGLAALTGDALEGGTEERDGAELARALEGIGARLSAGTGWDSTTVRLSCLADRLDEALGLLAEVVRRPAFPADEVERNRDQQLAKIRQRTMDPGSLAADETARLVYDDGVPYGRPLSGTEASVASADADTVRGFADAYYRPRGGGLVVVGDVEPREADERVERHFGAWTGGPPTRPDVEARPRTRERTIHVVHREGSVQSELRVSHPGVARSSPDYFSLVVANTVLGGAFTSRLNLNLREKHGFTYGVRSRFAFRRGAGPFTVSAAVGTDVTADAVREIVSELQALVDGGPTEDETRAARDYIAGVFPLRMETTGQVAARLAELVVYDLPDDWHARYRDRIRAVSRDDATAAVGRHIRPDEAQIVVVADADAVTDSLEALALGPVVVHEGPG